MMISTKGRYALRVMVDMAEHQAEGYLPLKEIAERQDISEKYLESILKVLVKHKFLTRVPEQYTVGSILRLTEGSLAPVACLEQEPIECPRMAQCRTLPMWRKLDGLIQDFFDGITLADLAASTQPGNDYVI